MTTQEMIAKLQGEVDVTKDVTVERNREKLKPGEYKGRITNFALWNSKEGFTLEIDVDGIVVRYMIRNKNNPQTTKEEDQFKELKQYAELIKRLEVPYKPNHEAKDFLGKEIHMVIGLKNTVQYKLGEQYIKFKDLPKGANKKPLPEEKLEALGYSVFKSKENFVQTLKGKQLKETEEELDDNFVDNFDEDFDFE